MWNAALQSTIAVDASVGTLLGMNATTKSGGLSRAILISQNIGALVSKVLRQGRAQAFKFRVGDQVHDALQKTRDGQWG